MQIVCDKITIAELKHMADNMFNNLVKAVVDIEKGIMAVDAEYHADEELLLLDEGSQQEFLWGINLYPDKMGDEAWIEFDSMINMRPSQGNRTRGIDDIKVQDKIRTIINKLVVP